jgi:hypothetical protein
MKDRERLEERQIERRKGNPFSETFLINESGGGTFRQNPYTG